MQKSSVYVALLSVSILLIGSGISVYLLSNKNNTCRCIIPDRCFINATTNSQNLTLTTFTTNFQKNTSAVTKPKESVHVETSLATTSSSLNTTTETLDCPDNWISYEQSCYFISHQSASWKDAMIRCKKLNGHLAEITSADEDQFLRHHIETLDRQNSRECLNASSNQYSGTTTTTYDGHTCQRWDSQTPHAHTQFNTFPEGSVTDAANYCRDPDGLGLPWCYTTDPKIRWQYCGIYECPGGNYWAGMVMLEDVWKWIHTETELDQGYTNWYHNQKREYCGALISELNYQWKRSNCFYTAMYICEQTKYR
ncbi:uncharacterized protein LOC132718025 [Ruditapes philippinarum]|uniref:uncharacterized protein LOC132718025 n=1 Tax=Ruditapes philippinarum TaxID=129788 RepID=UPI00295B9A17|nr:uncharacterized protein LOC132718025 [Ruditapes philippinarum]